MRSKYSDRFNSIRGKLSSAVGIRVGSKMESAPSKGRVLWNLKSMFSLSAETYFQSRFLVDGT